MKTRQELKDELLLAKTNEAFHRKQKEFYEKKATLMDKKGIFAVASTKIAAYEHKKKQEYFLEEITLLESRLGELDLAMIDTSGDLPEIESVNPHDEPLLVTYLPLTNEETKNLLVPITQLKELEKRIAENLALAKEAQKKANSALDEINILSDEHDVIVEKLDKLGYWDKK